MAFCAPIPSAFDRFSSLVTRRDRDDRGTGRCRRHRCRPGRGVRGAEGRAGWVPGPPWSPGMRWAGWPPRTARFRCARWRRQPGCAARRGTCTGTASRCATPPWTTVGCSPGYARWSPTWPNTPCRAPSCRTPAWSLHEHVGTVRFVDPHTVEADHGIRLTADKFILCAGGTNRALPVPGAELVGSHRDAWTLASVPESLLVIGAGATGVQVASVFAELGSQVMLFEAGPRILGTEDEDVSRIMAASFRAAGIEVREDFGRIRGFEKAPAGVRMVFAKDDAVDSVEATPGGRRDRLAGRHRRTELGRRRGGDHRPRLRAGR